MHARTAQTLGPPGDPGPANFERAAATVLGNLQRAFSDLVAEVAPSAKKAADVERAFGVDARLGWQVYRIATAENPLATGTNIPARVSIQRLCAAAAKKNVASEVIERAVAAFESFERLQQDYAEDKDELDTMISSLVPEAREKHELSVRQSAFKATAQIKGVAMAAWLGTWVFHPGSDESAVDHVFLLGQYGLRRLRPSARIVLGSGTTAKGESRTLALDGTPANESTGTLLPAFCSRPLPHFEAREADGMMYYRVVEEDIGLRAAADIVLADYRPNASQKYRVPEGRKLTGGATVVGTPAKRLTMDLLVHHSLFRSAGERGALPQVHVFDTAPRGFVVSPDDPTREFDRIEHSETVRPIVGGIAGAQLGHIPKYLEMLELVCATRGWNPDDFRGYRLDVQFPISGASYMVAMDLPEPPSER